MRLEVLITKYLDGELTVAEDQELRQLIAENPDAKGAFDQSVSVHHALRNDACLTTPSAQLVRETEDLIFMSILNQPIPVPEEPEKKRRFFALFSTGTAVLTTIALVLLPVLTNSIAYEKFPLAYQIGERTTPLPQSTVQENGESVSVAIADAGANGGAKGRRGNRREVVEQATAVPAVAFVINNGAENTSADADNPTLAAIPLSEEPSGVDGVYGEPSDMVVQSGMASVASSDDQSLSTLRRGSNTVLSVSLLPNGAFPGVAFGNKVHLTSTFGHDFLEDSGRKSSGLSFFSQSLAYPISDNENAGIELGYLWFSYSKPVLRLVTGPSGVNRYDRDGHPFGFDRKEAPNKIQGQSDGEDDPLNPGFTLKHPDGEYVTELQTLPKQTWWGAAFYERTLYEKDDISLQGRLGLGGSNDGALGYIRAVGLYRLLDNVSLSLGFDARGMVLRTSYVAPKTSSFKTSFSLVYGVQFHL